MHTLLNDFQSPLMTPISNQMEVCRIADSQGLSCSTGARMVYIVLVSLFFI